ncbi:MAG: glycosyltransferase family 2 protein, partial [bacterium]
PWLVFIDADVAVHADTLSRIVATVDEQPAITAVVGTYDEAPPAPGFHSQYRNLLHRYTHLSGAGEAHTFWAGCGAVDRGAFLSVGGFDERRYGRPQVEDIELGYRLRDAGGRILLQPDIQATHLKQWSFLGGLRTDLWDRGVPWVELLLERRLMTRAGTLNVKGGERTKTGLVGLSLLLAGVALATRDVAPAVLAGMLLAAVAVSNWRQVVWFARRRGGGFALLVVLMSIWYYSISGVCVVVAGTRYVMAGRGRSSSGGRRMEDTQKGSIESFPRTMLPMHKAAFGVATGAVAAIVVFVATVITVLRGQQSDFGIHLLSQYFAGYTVTWRGAFIGAAWAGFTGFVMGWFVAFARNATIAVLLTVIRTRAELAQTRDFLDHI